MKALTKFEFLQTVMDKIELKRIKLFMKIYKDDTLFEEISITCKFNYILY